LITLIELSYYIFTMISYSRYTKKEKSAKKEKKNN